MSLSGKLGHVLGQRRPLVVTNAECLPLGGRARHGAASLLCFWGFVPATACHGVGRWGEWRSSSLIPLTPPGHLCGVWECALRDGWTASVNSRPQVSLRRMQIGDFVLGLRHLLKPAWFGLLPEGPRRPLMRNKAAHSVCCFSCVKHVSERLS